MLAHVFSPRSSIAFHSGVDFFINRLDHYNKLFSLIGQRAHPMHQTRALVILLVTVHLMTYRMTRGGQPLVSSRHQPVADTHDSSSGGVDSIDDQGSLYSQRAHPMHETRVVICLLVMVHLI